MGASLDRMYRGVPAPLLFVAGGCSTYLGAAGFDGAHHHGDAGSNAMSRTKLSPATFT